MKRILGIKTQETGPRLRFSPPWLALSALALIGSLACGEIISYDFWWHLRTGQLIAETGAIPRQDPFSFSAAGAPWTAHEWLFEVGLFWIYQIGGWAGVIAAKAVLVTATMGLVLMGAWQITRHEAWAVLITVLTALTTMLGWFERPQLITYLFLAITLLLLGNWQRGASPRWLWILPVMTVIWVNVHGAYVVLFLVLAVYVGVGWGRWWRSGRAPEEASRVRFLMILGALCGGASLLNPHTYQAWLYPLQYLGPSIHHEFIQEWQSPNLGSLSALPFLLLLAGSTAALICIRAPLPPENLVLWGLFAVMALQSRRHIPLFALVAAPVLAECVGSAWRSWQLKLGETTRPSPSPVRRLGWLMPVLGAGVWLLTMQGAWANWQSNAQAALPVPEDRFPVGAVAYLHAHPQPRRMFNHYGWGGYLIWNLPEQRVFIDGRADMYGPKIIEDYRTLTQLKPGWKELLNRYDFDWILYPIDTPLEAVLSEMPQWEQVYADKTSVLFARRAIR